MSKVKRICKQCGKEFELYPSQIKKGQGIYCSRACHDESQRKKIIKTCKNCGKDYNTHYKSRNSKFCSYDCYYDFKFTKHLVSRTCLICGKDFKIGISYINRGDGNFCSRECNSNYRRGIQTVDRIKLTCLTCNNEFEVLPADYRRTLKHHQHIPLFCSQECFRKSNVETTIEKLIREELQKNNIVFMQEVAIDRYYVDFLINPAIIIECDGDYWHSTDRVLSRDKRKDVILTGLGYTVFRFSESEIKRNASNCIKKVFTQLL